MRPPWRYGSASPRPDRNSSLGGCLRRVRSPISGWRDGALYPLARGCRAPRRIMPELEATAPPIPVWGLLFGKFVLPGSVGGAGGVRHRELRGQRRQHPDRNNAVRCTLCGWSGRTVGSASPRLPLCPLRQDQLRVVDDRMSRAPRLAAATAAEPARAASARRPRSSQTEKVKQKSAAALGAASRARGKRHKMVNAVSCRRRITEPCRTKFASCTGCSARRH